MGGAEHNSIIMKSERVAVAGGWMAVGLRGLQLEHQKPRESKIKSTEQVRGQPTSSPLSWCTKKTKSVIFAKRFHESNFKYTSVNYNVYLKQY